jgi:hypothetical protein
MARRVLPFGGSRAEDGGKRHQQQTSPARSGNSASISFAQRRPCKGVGPLTIGRLFTQMRSQMCESLSLRRRDRNGGIIRQAVIPPHTLRSRARLLRIGGGSRDLGIVALENWRKVVGAGLALLYALFVLAPVGAVAAAPPGITVLCLSDLSGVPHDHAQPHEHHHDHGLAHDGPAPHHHGQDQGCCGLFGTSVLPPSRIDGVMIETRVSDRLVASTQRGLHGRTPPPVDRPPRSLLTV